MDALSFEIARDLLADFADAPLHGAAAEQDSKVFLAMAMRTHGRLPNARSTRSSLL
jgi:hypothetical protein